MSQKRLVEIAIKVKDESKGAFASLEQSLGSGKMKFAAFAVGAAAVGTALVKATEKLYDFTAEMAAAGDEFDKMALRTGIAVEELDALRFAAERGGGSLADVETGTRRLARSLGDLKGGLQEGKRTWDALGITLEDLTGPDGEFRGLSEILPLVADGIKNLGSQAQRIDIAQDLFGRGGTALLPMLKDGAAGVAAMRLEMEKYGGTITGTFTDKSAAFVDSQTNLANATQRLKEALSEPFLAPFTSAINALAEAITDAKRIGKIGIGDGEYVGGGEKRQIQQIYERVMEERRAPGATPWAVAAPGYETQAMREDAMQEAVRRYVQGMRWSEEGGSLGPGGLAGLVGGGPMPGVPLTPDEVEAIRRGPGRSPSAPSWLDSLGPAPEMEWLNDAEEQLASFRDITDAAFVGVEEMTAGLDDHIQAMRDAEQSLDAFTSAAQTLGQAVVPNLAASLDSAFYTALTSTQAFGRAFVGALRRTFADTLAQVGARLITSFLPIPVKSMTVGGGDKGMPPMGAMIDAGRVHGYASASYGEAYI